MDNSLTGQNKNYWQNYKPGEVPSVPKNLPLELIDQVSGPVLDVGTGDGVLAEDLSRNGFEVYGIDVAENIITENQKRKTNVYYSIDDITRRTKFLENFFDLLIFKFILTNIHKDSW
jgi:2-polyprenyl-3-methyl-5-hydroxy-6-metoxy-1,4-benzoquinol methylase